MVVGGDGDAGVPAARRRSSPAWSLRIGAGERVPVDVRIERGATDLDRSLVTGESLPVAAGPGDVLEAGTLNLTGAIEARGAAAAARLVPRRDEPDADGGRARPRHLRPHRRPRRAALRAGRASAWRWRPSSAGCSRRRRLAARRSSSRSRVLIITCPCALGLAVPVAHVVAAGRLIREGILLRDGTGARAAGRDRPRRLRQDRDAHHRDAGARRRAAARQPLRERRAGAGAALARIRPRARSRRSPCGAGGGDRRRERARLRRRGRRRRPPRAARPRELGRRDRGGPGRRGRPGLRGRRAGRSRAFAIAETAAARGARGRRRLPGGRHRGRDRCPATRPEPVGRIAARARHRRCPFRRDPRRQDRPPRGAAPRPGTAR